MLTVKQLFRSLGLEVEGDRIKLVRHSGPVVDQVIAEGVFELFQSEQQESVRPFHGCDVILSFLGRENNKAEFHGAYRVLGSRPIKKKDLQKFPRHLRVKATGSLWYELEELPQYNDLRGRLVVQWKSTRGWHQKKDLDIYEILPPFSAAPFPGFQDVFLSWDELKRIFAEPRAHKDWKAALQSNAGIYRIVDESTGQMYIGSA